MFQSTHPRGVRQRENEGRAIDDDCFNPRTRVGCDPSSLGMRSSLLTFQSTHPRGVRRPASTSMLTAQEFQSTHPRGVRQFPCFIQ